MLPLFRNAGSRVFSERGSGPAAALLLVLSMCFHQPLRFEKAGVSGITLLRTL